MLSNGCFRTDEYRSVDFDLFLSRNKKSKLTRLPANRLPGGLGAWAHIVSGRLARTARVPLGVGDFVVGDAAHNFLAVVNDAAVVGAVAERETDVLGPFVGFLVPLGTLLGRRDRGPGARNQALVDGDSGLWLAVVATRKQKGLPTAKIDDGNRVRLSIGRKFLRRRNLQCAAAADFHDVGQIVGARRGAKIRISRARGSDGECGHALAIQHVGNGKASDTGLDFAFS